MFTEVLLPYSDIDQLAQYKIQYGVDVTVISFDEQMVDADLAALSKHLMDSLDRNPTPGDISSRYRTNVKEKTTQESSLLSSSTSVSDLDAKLNEVYKQDHNHYYVILLPQTSQLKVKAPVIGLNRNIFFTKEEKDIKQLADQIGQTLKEVVVRERSVLKAYEAAKGSRDQKPDKERMRTVRSHPGYDITFTLVNSQPDIIDAQWDIQHAVHAYLEPLTKRLKKYAAINVQSQVLYFTQMMTKPKTDKEKNEHYYTTKELPLIINPIEANLGSPASNNPELNFLVYVPTRDEHPLHIRDDTGMNLASNAFLSPRWGGIYICNIPSPPQNASLPVRPSIDMKKVMEIFLFQLRLLFNLLYQGSTSVDLIPVGNTVVAEWELDGWLRSHCVENLATATATLQSLAQLLGQISNIVINDDIGQEVQSAVQSIKESYQLLKEGFLEKAFLASREAIISSEKAFFDPSLLELLYFPEDQKFAIYIPLFLPISFPVFSSLFKAFKWFRETKGLTKAKQE
ncbi:hypothetical protein ACJMK2_006904 [Sinanodonta woodiana]|uniref:GPI transamidase component PIG-S n=1 Tax=Sinanodonta woodiana TaxID=1069815 RepID=A0ABD3VXV3_SINWO